MPVIRVGEENSNPIYIHYQDLGSGDPVVLIHGWPLSGRSWEMQVPALLEAGYRVITYDRRGFGESSQPSVGYDFETLASDLNLLLTELDLNEVSLVGFSMGGGEVARYLGTFGSKRIKKAVFVSAVTPFLLKTAENPEGVEASIFDGIKHGLTIDRPAYLAKFLANFYNVDVLKAKSISDEAVHFSWIIAAMASPLATLKCVDSWGEDFRDDLAKVDVPTLIVHGDDDRVVPLQASGDRMSKIVRGSRMVVIEGGPHGLVWTHADRFNRELIGFLADEKRIGLVRNQKSSVRSNERPLPH